MTLSKLPQDLFKGMHSNNWTNALRAIPGDIAVTLPDHQFEALVRSIDAYAVSVAERVRKEIKP